MNAKPPEPVLKSQRKPLLQISDLTVDFDTPTGWLRCLHGVDLEVYPGEILGLVGESGSGKSITCMALMKLLGPRARIRGNIRYKKQDILTLDENELTQMRGRDIAMVFQDPVMSLNPVHTIGRQIVESIIYNTGIPALNHTKPAGEQIAGMIEKHQRVTGRDARIEAERLMSHVGIPETKQRLKEYPHQLSGGMNQRVMIAMALAGRPQLLIADEPTTALDVTIQAQILELIRDLRKEIGMSIILITHDLSVVAETSDRLAVMYCGRIVEKGPVTKIFSNPRHPYTRGLLASLLRIDRRVDTLFSIEGSVPTPYEMTQGCAFEPRCQVALNKCKSDQPALKTGPEGCSIACFNPQSGKAAGFAVLNKQECTPYVSQEKRNGHPVLEAADLLKYFRIRKRGGLFGEKKNLKAVDGVSFSVNNGETFGIVGESGCGKSTIARLLLNIHTPTSGAVMFNGRKISGLPPARWRKIRLHMQYVFQNPLDALDRRMKIIDQVAEPLLIHKIVPVSIRHDKAAELLRAMDLKDYTFDRYPHELSGGQQQRVVLARALILSPELLICDEPTSALDVSIQAQVINLLTRLRKQMNLTMVFISHDLSIVRHVCEQVAVMYLGKFVEVAKSDLLFNNPAHPYTRALLSAIPIPEPGLNRKRIFLEGDPPSPIDLPPGCSFRMRCHIARQICAERIPELKSLKDGQSVACHLAHGKA